MSEHSVFPSLSSVVSSGSLLFHKKEMELSIYSYVNLPYVQ